MMDVNETHRQILLGLVRRAKAEIIVDAVEGRFAARPHQGKDGQIRSYSDLHDYVDANEYGGACRIEVSRSLEILLGFHEENADDAFAEVINQFFGPMQEAVDLWITQGGLHVALAHVGSGLSLGLLRALSVGIPVCHPEVSVVLGEV